MQSCNDDEILFDMLTIENKAVKAYGFALISCTTQSIHENLVTILFDQHQICLEVKDELSKRGFLCPVKCSKDEIKTVLEQFKAPN